MNNNDKQRSCLITQNNGALKGQNITQPKTNNNQLEQNKS